jgi:hypothetical protein
MHHDPIIIWVLVNLALGGLALFGAGLGELLDRRS